jgi:hypothetical protein
MFLRNSLIRPKYSRIALANACDLFKNIALNGGRMRTLAHSLIVLFGSWALAQTVDVKNVDANSQGTTTIRVDKGYDTQVPITVVKPPAWEVNEGTTDIEGDAGATGRDAKDLWKKACDDWKKEFRADNKENKVLLVNCGSPSCGGEAGNKVCTSKASYKVKTRTDQ